MSQFIRIDLIDIPADRSREFSEAGAEMLAGMIAAGRLIHPISVRPNGDRFTLVTGLHRLSAFIILDRDSIPSEFSSATTDDEAKLEELTENLGRNELNALDRAHHLYDLKQVYERLYPETKAGTAGALAKHGAANEIFSFAAKTAEQTGLSKRSIELAVALWKGLSVETRRRCAGTWIADHQTSLQNLAKLTPAIQIKALDILLGKKPAKNANSAADVEQSSIDAIEERTATTVADALTIIENGRPLSHVEKKFETINKTLSGLKEHELDAVVIAHADLLIAALKRAGRL